MSNIAIDHRRPEGDLERLHLTMAGVPVEHSLETALDLVPDGSTVERLVYTEARRQRVGVVDRRR